MRNNSVCLMTEPMNHLDLFSGIGGFALGLQMAGSFRTTGFCEIKEYPRKILSQHWPNVPIIEDIHDVSAKTLANRGIGPIDIITAGFPCQPFSPAGRNRGIDDKRFLWPELFRVIAEVRPRYVILENSWRILTNSKGIIFAGILYDFRQIGYDVEWQVIPASAVGAWHIRNRIWIVAYPTRERCQETGQHCQRPSQRIASSSEVSAIPNPDSSRLERLTQSEICEFESTQDGPPIGAGAAHVPYSDKCRCQTVEQPKLVFSPERSQEIAAICRGSRSRGEIWGAEPNVGRVANGVPQWMDRVEAIGNAVVPQVVEFIGQCIVARDALQLGVID